MSPRETHGRRQFASYFTPPLVFSVHYIIPGNIID